MPTTTLLYFRKADCRPCKMMVKVFEASESLLADVDLQTISLEDSPETFDAYAVQSTPSIILLRDESEVARRSGFLDPTEFATFLAS